MSQADLIRKFVWEQLILPARSDGLETVEIRAGDVHAALGLSNRMPAICSALRSSKFEELAGVVTVSILGPRVGANVYFRFALGPSKTVSPQTIQTYAQNRSSPLSPKMIEAPDLKESVVLVACVSEKGTSPEPARQLYRSPWFQKARSYVEVRGSRWYILSARHGVLSPDEIIAPYDRTLVGATVAERRDWARSVHRQIVSLLPSGVRVIVFAGRRYREFLVPALIDDGFRVEVPMEGFSIGKQLAWLSNQT